MPEPSTIDVINLLINVPNKTAFAEMQSQLLSLTKENKSKINNVQKQVESVSSNVSQNTEKIASMEYTIQSLQQDKLRQSCKLFIEQRNELHFLH